MGRSNQVGKIVPVWIEAVKLEKGRYSAENNARWIKPFLDGFDGFEGRRTTPLSDVSARDLLLYRSALAKKHAAGTVNAYLLTAKRLLVWSMENEFRKPVILTGVRPVREEGERPSKAWTPAQVRDLLGKADQFNRQVYLWCACQYLGLLRPSEILTLVLARHGIGEHKAELVSEGVWSIWGKTSHKSGLRRYLVLPPEAEPLLAECEPCWSSWRTYWGGCNTAMDAGPHQFRHSSIQHLQHLLGPEQISTVELLCGHYGQFKVLLKHYAQPQWQALRKYGSMLAANVPGLAVNAEAGAAA